MEDVALLPTPASTDPIAVEPLPCAEQTQGFEQRSARITHYTFLVLITLLGGVLRFAWLDRPPIWGDEAATFGRVCSTFRELMGRLQEAGFAPLHYELYWWIGQHRPLTPFVMRLIPAIAGTLMIPAMYWLAVQLTNRRVALITALLTASSAYLLNFSRDAKMYSHFWLFCVLNVASLLWWLRVRTRLSWCVWLTTGTLMVGFQALGWIIVLIELPIVLSCARPNWPSLLRLLVLLPLVAALFALTIAPVLAFYIYFFIPDLRGSSPMYSRWFLLFLAGLGILNLIRLDARFFLRKIAPESAWNVFRNWSTERALLRPWSSKVVGGFRWPPLALFIVGVGILFAGPFGYYHDFNRYLDRLEVRRWDASGISWVEFYNFGRTGPGLVAYTASAYLTGWEWPKASDERMIVPRTLWLLKGATLSLTVLLALGLLPWWKRRRSAILDASGSTSGWRTGLWFALWIALPFYGFYCVSIPRHDEPQSWLVDGYHSLKMIPWWGWAGTGLIAAGWIWISATTWLLRLLRIAQFLAIIAVTLLLLQAFYAKYPAWDAWLAEHSRGWRTHGSVWITRYLAVTLPAVLICIAILLSRLPTRPLRWGAIGLFVVVNLSVHGARMFAGTEPPTPLMVQDYLDARAGEKTAANEVRTRTYFDRSLRFGGGYEPGTVSLHSGPTRYYVSILSGMTSHAWPERGEPMDYDLHFLPPAESWMSFSSYVINDVRRLPELRRFVTWERLAPQEVNLLDKPLDALEPQWRLESDEQFSVRDHWRWTDTCVLRRRVYVRAVAPTTSP